MKIRETLVLETICVCLLGTTAAWAQALPTAATIESVSLELTMPDRYQVGSVLEPIRKVSLVAPGDGIIRSMEARLGAVVREGQEMAQLDRSEAAALVKIAEAEVKEKQAVLGGSKEPLFQAQVEVAQARVELARIQLDRLTIKAPFAGRIIALSVGSGQYVLKGTVIAELADVSSLKAQVPVDRRGVAPGADLQLVVEEQESTGKIQSIMPLSEAFSRLRELAAPFGSAWVLIPNPGGELEPGLRVFSKTLPAGPIATVPKNAVRLTEGGQASLVQVIRGEYVTNVPIATLGKVGSEQVQVTGSFRHGDALIVSSSVPLLPGTLVRFGQGTAGGVEGTTPSPGRLGLEAGIVPPARSASGAGGVPATSGSRTRPASPATKSAPRRQSNAPASSSGGSVPF